MNKWSKKSAFIALSLILLIGFTGCEDTNKEEVANESKSSVSQDNKEADVPKADVKPKYSNLRIVNDLSQFDLPLELFSIGGYSIYFGDFKVELNKNAVNEFERDEWREKIKKEGENSLEAALKNAKKSDKDSHVRLVSLDIPVTYSKQGSDQAVVEVTDLAPVFKIGKSELILLSDYVKQRLNNEYISNYILPSKNKTRINVEVEHETIRRAKRLRLKIDDTSAILNTIGKNNKGVDTITELTLIPHIDRYESYTTVSRDETDEIIMKFYVTSFKLKSTEKRFVRDYDGIYGFVSFKVKEDDAVIPYAE